MSPTLPQDSAGSSAPAASAEKRDQIHFAAKDEGLRRDVHDLGVIVGQVLLEQGGAELFRLVEDARRAAIARRESQPGAEAALDQIISSVPLHLVADFIRSFSTYFQAVNAAELVHRIRRRRQYLREGQHRQPGGLEDAMCQLRDSGISLDDLRALMASMEYVPVLTAHPTEPTRRTILRRQQDIVRRLIDMQNVALSPQETAADLDTIRTDITTIWQTEEHPTGSRTIADELEHVLYFVTAVVFRMAPLIFENFEAALRSAYGEEAAKLRAPVMFRLSSWIGGDLVGRAEVTARTIRDALARHRSLVLDLYHRECRQLSEKLSQGTTRSKVAPELLRRIDQYIGHFPNAPGLVPVRYREMPYRVFMRLVMARLQATYAGGVYPYESADEFAADISLVASSLEANRGTNAGLFNVRRLMRRIDTFGFHLMTADIRQDALTTRRVVGHCLDDDGWLERTSEHRTRRLRQALTSNESAVRMPDNEAKRAIGILSSISFCRRRFGDRSIGPYVVAMAEDIDDVLAVMLLAQWGDLRAAGDAIPLDIAPAFETVAALGRATQVMQRLWQDPLYARHIETRSRRQLVMLGIADHATDADLASARVALRHAQRDLMAAADAARIELVFFHGRSGAISPGGGKAHAEIRSAPRGTVRGRFHSLEPGELLANKFGVRAIALRTVEQALAAVMASSLAPGRDGPPAEWEQALATLVTASRESYHELLGDSRGFLDYYRRATPVDVIERMRRGTGPETLIAEGLLAAVGAAPWMFAWTQSRNMLPGWYGLGRGLAAATEAHGEGLMQEMASQWHFFRTMLSDVETAIAKSDLDIAARYSALAGDLHGHFFPRIATEFAHTRDMILRVLRQQSLLESNRTLRRSIRLRNPYVDPMSLLQVELLRRWRESGDASLLATLIGSINGIARGLQDAG